MKGRFLIAQYGAPIERDIYADKSALVLQWLLLKGSQKEQFTLREAANESGASLGLDHTRTDAYSLRALESYLKKSPAALGYLLSPVMEQAKITDKISMLPWIGMG